jgi:hypothetical protein
MEDGPLLLANPPDDVVYAGCFPGLTIVCTAEAAVDRPSQLDPRFLKEAVGRTVYLHAMHSVVDWFAYAKWSPVGELMRSLSLSPDDGVAEDIGVRLPFEDPYCAGEHPVDWDEYPLPFHPLELGEAALRALFGFNYEGVIHDDDIDLDQVVLAGFRLSAATGTSAAASPTPSCGETRAPKMGRSTFRWLRRR